MVSSDNYLLPNLLKDLSDVHGFCIVKVGVFSSNGIQAPEFYQRCFIPPYVHPNEVCFQHLNVYFLSYLLQHFLHFILGGFAAGILSVGQNYVYEVSNLISAERGEDIVEFENDNHHCKQ